MVESTDVEFLRNLLIVIFLAVTSVASCVTIAFAIIIALRITKIMDAARETMKNVRGE
ncbi:MAG: hypothetical protein R6U37_05940 [Dehalococcoidia bacterium]